MRTPILLLLVGAMALTASLRTAAIFAQPGANRNKPVPTRALDAKASQLVEGFVKESLGLAMEYEQAGEPDKAKQMLETVLTFHPDAEAIKQKIKEIDEKLLSSNEVKVEIEPGRGWGSPVAQVRKGGQVRIQSNGTYRMVVTATLGPEGLPTGDPLKGDSLAEGVTCGALMGVVIGKDKPGKPFTIGAGREYTAERDGLLFLRLNTPPGSKCTGKVTATLSGELVRMQ